MSGRARERIAFAGAAILVCCVSAGGALLLTGGGRDRGPRKDVLPTLPAQRTADLAQATRAAGAQLIRHPYAFGINVHVTNPVRYPTNPPTNGPHHPVWAQDGSYAARDAPPTERVVHAQEHGRVVLQYQPGLAREKVQQLKALFAESPHHVLLVENRTEMPCEVAATAWGRGLRCPNFTPASLDALRAFRDRYRDKGPEPVP